MVLSVIIVNYNTKELLKRCLKSVFQSVNLDSFEVFVSDNGSTDGSEGMVKSEFPQVKLIQNKENLGFAKANNVAIKKAMGLNILLLNSDTEVMPDTFEKCVNFLNANKNVGALGCRILLPDGTLDPASRRKFPNPYNSFLRLFGLKKFSDYNIIGPVDRQQEVDSVCGAFMMIKKDVVDKVGLLDEDYFMYGEDIDWCLRIKNYGYKIIYFPQAVITHFKYGSSQAIPYKTIKMAHDAMRIFYDKHQAKQHSLIFNWLVHFGIFVRMYLVMFRNFFVKRKKVH